MGAARKILLQQAATLSEIRRRHLQPTGAMGCIYKKDKYKCSSSNSKVAIIVERRATTEENKPISVTRMAGMVEKGSEVSFRYQKRMWSERMKSLWEKASS